MTEEALRELVAKLGRVDGATISDSTVLSALLGGSLGRARLDAALRASWAINNSSVYTVKTFGELCAALSLRAASPAPPLAPAVITEQKSATAESETAKVGIDTESVAALPVTSDYWEESFYKATFTPREIAHALLQPQTLESFAGLWCAKEALRKSDPVYAHLPWQQIEVVHDAAGKPSLAVDGRALAASLSISHAAGMAVAVVVQMPAFIAPIATPPQAESLTVVPHGESRTGLWATAAFSLVLSLAALALSILRR